MTSIAVTEFETRLQWEVGQRALLTTEQAPSIPLEGTRSGPQRAYRWDPETLLVAAVEGRTLLSFLEHAQAEGVEVLFYQSSAVGRRVEAPGGHPHFTDLIVRPHVVVRDEADAERVRHIFQSLPGSCFPSSMIRLTPRIEPIVEVWKAADAPFPQPC